MDKNYIPAYTISNEDQRWATSAVPNAKRVLTVTGSGDQAIFYHLNGATHIDTFDITHFARGIQDIKTTALRVLPYEAYVQLLIDLNHAVTNEKNIKNMDKIFPLLPTASQKLFEHDGWGGRFNAGIARLDDMAKFPTRDEYARMQATIVKPFNFIHSPLHELHQNISAQYDIINISNIFDKGYEASEQGEIMFNLLPHLNVGGRFLYLPQWQSLDYSKINFDDKKRNMAFSYEKTYQHPTDKWAKIISLRRTR